MLLLLLSFALAAESTQGGEAEERPVVPGYKDTPLLPGTQWHVHDPDRPAPARVQANGVPSDAVVLFDGESLSRWQETDWTVKDGALEAGRKNLVSKDTFGDIQLHIEWAVPEKLPPEMKASSRGNSGVLLMGLYELQVFDSFGTEIYPDGQAGAIYGQTPPLVNASRKPGAWQTYDIVFVAPRFKDGRLERPGYLTAFHNGVLIHHHVEILGAMAYRKLPKYTPHAEALPLVLQAHGCPVRYRNIWVRRLGKG